MKNKPDKRNICNGFLIISTRKEAHLNTKDSRLKNDGISEMIFFYFSIFSK
jgi:hypothetical protein